MSHAVSPPRSMTSTPSSTCTGAADSGRVAGPSNSCPSAPNREPWQGHCHSTAVAFQPTTQPLCGQCAVTARQVPPGAGGEQQEIGVAAAGLHLAHLTGADARQRRDRDAQAIPLQLLVGRRKHRMLGAPSNDGAACERGAGHSPLRQHQELATRDLGVHGRRSWACFANLNSGRARRVGLRPRARGQAQRSRSAQDGRDGIVPSPSGNHDVRAPVLGSTALGFVGGDGVFLTQARRGHARGIDPLAAE